VPPTSLDVPHLPWDLVTYILEGLDAATRRRVETLRGRGEFFWIDVSLGDASEVDLRQAMGLSDDALPPLFNFGEGLESSRMFHTDGKHLVFAFSCYLESAGHGERRPFQLRGVEVHVVVTGEFILTLHEERASLPTLLTPDIPEGRSEQYTVYAILDAMIVSAFDALNEVEKVLENLAVTSTNVRSGRLRLETVREITTQLNRLRRRAAVQRGLSERIGLEIGRVEGLHADDEPYFERIGQQVNRQVDAIDAAAQAAGQLIDLRLNETIYWLTVVSTIFLPLTFVTGFFGMNFAWLVGEVDSALAFWLLGVGSLLLGATLTWRLILRGNPPS
jgi:magnesium transporter